MKKSNKNNATVNNAIFDIIASFHQTTDENNMYELTTVANSTKTEKIVDFVSLLNDLNNCKTKHQLVDTLHLYGLNTTTIPTDTPNTNDLYIQFVSNKSRILFGKRTLKFYTCNDIANENVFNDFWFDDVNDGSYRTKRATVQNTVDNFKLIMNYFLQTDVNWLPTK